MRQYKAIGFDMDGTLLDTKVDYAAMRDIVFDEMINAGVPESELDRSNNSKSLLDHGINYLIKIGKINELYDIEEHMKEKAKIIELKRVSEARVFPGTHELIEHLKSKGYKIGVLTRGSREYAEKALKLSGVLDELDALVCRDDHSEAESKPSPLAMKYFATELGVKCVDILYVGDSKMDYLCAINSGADFIGTLRGTCNKSDWDKLNSKIMTIDTTADLIKIL